MSRLFARGKYYGKNLLKRNLLFLYKVENLEVINAWGKKQKINTKVLSNALCGCWRMVRIREHTAKKI